MTRTKQGLWFKLITVFITITSIHTILKGHPDPTVTDGRHMDKAPGVRVCVFVSICLTLVNRLSDSIALILWWSAFTACVLRLVAGHTVAILGSCILSSILFIHRQVSRQGRCAYVFVCAGCGVRGDPWGEAGQSSPVAALGQGMAIQDTCLGHSQNLRRLPSLCVLSPLLLSLRCPSHAQRSTVCWPLFNPTAPRITPLVLFLVLFFFRIPNLFIVAPFPPLSCCLSLFLRLFRSLSTSVFWQGCISSLAVLFGGEWGSPRGRQSTLILIRRRTEQSRGWELWAVNGTGQLSEPTTTLLLHVCLQA